MCVTHSGFVAVMYDERLTPAVVVPDGLRRLFCMLSMQEIDGGLSLMERLILADTQLWKGQSPQGYS